MSIHYSRFAVGEAPYCVWGRDLPQQTLDFLDSLDPTFFSYMAELHGTAINEERSAVHAALALRLSYSHALETMLSLLAAAVQAPDCVVGWVYLYREPHLEAVLEALSTGTPIPTKLDLSEPTWAGLSEAVHRCLSLPDKDKEGKIKQGFADFWERAAHAYRNDNHRLEYNSIKHGLRVRQGGFTLRARREKAPGIPDPDAPVHTLASGRFGSSWYTLEKVGSLKHHFYLRHHSVNWQPQALVDGLHLAAMSLQNIIGFLRAVNGVDPTTIHVHQFRELDVFESAWEGSPGSEAFSMGTAARPEDIDDLSPEEIMAVYEVSTEPKTGG